MIAEIHRKLGKSGSKLNDRLEDQLTGDFFGSLRYLPFDMGIKPILQNCVFPLHLLECLNGVQVDYWDEYMSFWNDCKWNRTEPDAVINLGEIVILIEVKLYSGLSSDDDVDSIPETIIQSQEEVFESSNQLGRESRLLISKFPNAKKRVLLLLAPEMLATKIFESIKKRELSAENIIAQGVDFGYITWQKTLTALKSIICNDAYQSLIIKDITDLLTQKGFKQFADFYADDLPAIVPDDYWIFEYAYAPMFRFNFTKRIRKGLFYEFN